MTTKQELKFASKAGSFGVILLLAGMLGLFVAPWLSDWPVALNLFINAVLGMFFGVWLIEAVKTWRKRIKKKV